eukprot:TRINITY_DN92979_c0_g1_i1.p1 TRINITY_DN92979_c0_g1~~TRINITY_DN92979_c0_g1_i1.p1  ORF type:complete len:193 (-),score=0.72 TRINITY_DN92979_c0_g1_i1:68-589(-)
MAPDNRKRSGASAAQTSAPNPASAPKEAVSLILEKLFSIDAQPHEHQTFLVGASCILLSAPAVLSIAHGDWVMALGLVFIGIFSFLADYLYVGSIWNVIDRWIATAFTLYFYYRAWPVVPIKATVNLIPIVITLSYSRASKTRAEWRFRHSLWHLVMTVDMAYFLWCIYDAID